MPLLRHLDLVVLAVALPVFLVAGLPMAGYATGAVAWLLQAAIKVVSERKAKASTDPRTVVGITAGSMIGRGWLSALLIFAGFFIAGQEDAVGLSSAVLVLLCFTASFTVTLILRPFDRHQELPS